MTGVAADRACMGSGASAAMRDWDRAYEMFPRYAGTQFELAEACMLFAPSDWEGVRAPRAAIHFEGDPEGVIEETMRILVRKTA